MIRRPIIRPSAKGYLAGFVLGEGEIHLILRERVNDVKGVPLKKKAANRSSCTYAPTVSVISNGSNAIVTKRAVRLLDCVDFVFHDGQCRK